MIERSGKFVPEQGEFDHEPDDREPSRPAAKSWPFRGPGLLLAFLVWFLLGGADVSADARVVAAVATLMAVRWMTEAVPLSITSLLTLRRVGTHPRQIILGLMISTAFLSLWGSNTATTLMMLPIGLSVLTPVVENSRSAGTQADSDAMAEGIRGGKAISDELARTVGFAQWMMLGVPIVVVFIVLARLLITRVIVRFDLAEWPGGKELINQEIAALGPMSKGEKTVLAVFLVAAFFWIVPGPLSGIGTIGEQLLFPDLFDDTVVAIGAGVLLFLLPGDQQGNMTLEWKDAEEGLPWGVLLLFGGGLSLAAAVAGTGLDAWFGAQVSGLGALPIILLLAAVVTIVPLLTEITSNTATAATVIPILGGIVLNLVGVILITIFTVLIGPFAPGLVI